MSSGYTSPSSMITISVVLPILATVTIGLRFFARRCQKSTLMLDDWALVPALIFTIAMGADIIVGVRGHGVGYPTPNPTRTEASSQLTVAGKVEWVNLWLQPLALGCIKISLLAFYNRIFCVHRSGLFYLFNSTILGLTVAWMVAFFFALLFMCGTTFSLLWGPYINLYTYCAFGHPLWIDQSLAISDFCFDVIIFFLPLYKIWSLHIEKRRRIFVSIIFLIGASAIVGSILRMVVFIQTQRAIDSKDPTVDGLILVTKFLFWSMFEVGLAIIASCLPTLNSLLSKMNASKIIRSIRSMMSLNSLRSVNPQHTSSSADDNCSTSSQAKIARSPTAGDENGHYGTDVYKLETSNGKTFSLRQKGEGLTV